jgi:hypothetical protein
MTKMDFITELYCRIADDLMEERKHAQAVLWPSEIIPLGLLHALKGVSNRAFYRGLTRDYGGLFPRGPERTRLFRVFKTHRAWTFQFLAKPTLLGIVDSFGIELIHPIRGGRSPRQIGRKGLSNHRWIVGGKLCLVVNHLGGHHRLGVGARQRARHVVSSPHSDLSEVDGGPGRHRLSCRSGRSCQSESLPAGRMERPHADRNRPVDVDPGEPFQEGHAARGGILRGPRLAFTVALFNLLVQWQGWQPDEDGFVPLSIADFSL